MDVALKMPFFTLSNADIYFTHQGLHWRFYTPAKALLTTRHIELIDRKEFAAATLDKDDKPFVVHVASLAVRSKISIHPSWAAQIASLIAD